MRILHVSNYLPYSHHKWGGAEMACRNILDMLSESKDISCGVVSTLPQQRVNGCFEFFPVSTIPDRYPAPYFHDMRHFWLQKDSNVKKQIKEIIKKFSPDLVHFHNFHVLTFSSLEAVAESGIPAVASIYDYWLFCPTDMLLDVDNKICKQGHGFSCIHRCLKTRLQKKSHYLRNLPIFTRRTYFQQRMRLFNRIIALSDNSRRVILRHNPDGPAVDVAPLPLQTRKPHPGFRSFETPTIMFAGWVQARKGPDVLVRAMADVVKKQPRARLIIVGPLSESSFEAYIKNLVVALGVEKNVIFTGKLPAEEFNKIFYGSLIVAIAEQWENMSPVFALEAMSAKKAIVTGAIGGIPEYIRNGEDGITVTYNDPKAYAEAIIKLLDDEKLVRDLGESALKRVTELCSRDRVFEKLVTVYNRAILDARSTMNCN